MFSKSQRYYDVVYRFKNYQAEAAKLYAHIEARKTDAKTLLDVACGTGAHLPFLSQWFNVEGVDLDPGMIEIAKSRNPGIPFSLADMVTFDLQRQFDVVVCLFSAVAYAGTQARLQAAIAAMARHVLPGGLLIVEPFFTPDDWKPGRYISATFADEPELKIARMVVPEREGSLARFDFHYLVGTPEGAEHFVERHELGLFTHEQYHEAFTRLELSAFYETDWPTRRGLYISVLPG